MDSLRLFSREYDFPKTLSLTENQFSPEDLFLYNWSLVKKKAGMAAADSKSSGCAMHLMQWNQSILLKFGGLGERKAIQISD